MRTLRWAVSTLTGYFYQHWLKYYHVVLLSVVFSCDVNKVEKKKPVDVTPEVNHI